MIGKTATTITTEKGLTRITYHSTHVVQFNDKKIVLNNGGWKTVTTMKRMNQTSKTFDLKFNVFQKNFEWFVNTPKGKTIPFENSMILDRL